MITEDYVSFETAKLLKEKGFDVKCEYCYAEFSKDDIEVIGLSPAKCVQSLKEDRYPYVTLQMAMKWLRENHKIHIDIDYIDFLEHGEVWSAKIVDMVTFKETKIESTWNHYEQMANEAIEFYLKNLNK